ncbi:MAG: VCBS repeat-containing protein [Thermoanaerobaculia bacterium]
MKYDGTAAASFPKTLPREVVSTPAVGPVTLAGGSVVTAIIIGYGSNNGSNVNGGGLRAYDTAGNLLWERLSGTFVGATAPIVTAPAIGDLDGDGKNEVVWTGFDEFIHVSDAGTGAEKPGFPYRTYDTIWSSPALFDLDGDGRLEIIVGSDQHFQAAPISTPDGGGLYVVRADGTNFGGFPKFLDQVITSSPAVGDIDGDGKPEIVVGTGGFWPSRVHAVYAFHCDGTAVSGWPVSVLGQVVMAPALADLNGDGVPEVVVTDDNSGPDQLRRCYAIRGSGAPLFAPVVIRDYFAANLSAGDPMVGDVLGNSSPEILIPTNGEICVISSTGVQLTDNGSHPVGGFTFGVSGSLYNIAVGTLDNSATSIDVVAIAPSATAGATGVWVWNPKAPTLPVPWGMFQHDELHRGVVPGTPNCATATRFYALTPCRLIDTRGISPGAIGGPALSANEARAFTLTNRCSVPATARGVSFNAAVTGPGGAGFISIYLGTLRPTASSLSFSAGITRANNGLTALPLDGSGAVTFANVSPAAVHLILDVNGYFQ